ncbi:MAG: stage V sporulation protein AC [Syntrophomonadaceae bacterium]|nr:stage V sporulation protein AC [Syntrophomonadaceae bacterium]
MDSASEQLKQAEIDEYDQLVKKIEPKPPVVKNCIWAFVVGGLICAFGQLLINFLMSNGLNQSDAGSGTSVILIFLATLFTGLGLYDELGKYAGAGSIVPITGFANAIVASAMEFRREGYIFGVGARIFSVAGPTLVFGFTVAVLVGLLKIIFTS